MTILIILSISTVSLLSYHQYTLDLRSQFSKKNAQIIGLVSMNVNTYLDDLFRLSLSPYYNDAVMDALDKKVYGDEMKYLERLRIVEGFLDEMMIIPRSDILRVMIFTDEIYSSERIPMALATDVNYKSYSWYKNVMKAKAPIFLPAQLDQMVKHPKNKVFSVVNILRSTRNTDRILGVIKVDATYSGIESICSRINMGTGGGIYIIDENNQVLYSNMKNIPYDIFRKKLVPDSGYVIQKYGNESYLTNSTSIPRANWTIVSVSSLGEIYKTAAQTRRNSLLLAVLSTLLAVIIIAILARLLLKSFLSTVSLIRKVEKGDFSIRFPEEQKDEVGYLDSALNRMLTRINEMMDKNTLLAREVYEANYLQKEAQLKSLYNQIRPHFIYNTLNMISLLIQTGKSDKAVDNTNRLSSLLRGMTNWDKDIPLENELKLLDAYLGIQANRYEGRLTYAVDVDEAYYSCRIPALILQPIVENSVIHGCEHRREETVIRIWCEEQDNRIILGVEDNGGGIEPEALKKLTNKLETFASSEDNVNFSAKTGIGLCNVNRRIKIKYGSEFGLSIDSSFHQSTTVRIQLPATIKEAT